METLRSVAALSRTERRLFVEAAVVVVSVRLALRVTSFRTVRRAIDRLGGAGDGHRGPTERDRIARAARTASGRVPGRDTCLVRALTAAVMLVRRGHPATLRVGVEPTGPGELNAHMWVESEGRIVVGAAGARGYEARLPPMELGRP